MTTAQVQIRIILLIVRNIKHRTIYIYISKILRQLKCDNKPKRVQTILTFFIEWFIDPYSVTSKLTDPNAVEYNVRTDMDSDSYQSFKNNPIPEFRAQLGEDRIKYKR